MSRLGKMPIKVPAGVKIQVASGNVNVEGPRGKLKLHLPLGIELNIKDGVVETLRKSDEQKVKSCHGLVRTLLNNMVIGVSQGYTKTLTIHAVMAIRQLGKDAWQKEKNWPFENISVQHFIADILSQSNEMLLILAEMYTIRVIELAEEHKLDLASQYLTQILHYRPDPSELNNTLRLQLALMLRSEDDKYFTQSRVTELESLGALGTWTKMRLLLSGFYGKKYPRLLFGTIFFAVSSLLLFHYCPQLLTQKKPQPKQKKAGGSGYHHVATSADEYSMLLHLLNLPEDATDKEIKYAYRMQVKELHPDRVSNILSDKERVEAMERFTQITEAYDRIMEIRKGWFGN